ncbi:MAG: bifunctional oligoribonuclease/PAP phosphatase NrnA [Bacteroidota bacterium]|nr:bifunctional oligoribonuclease/PAP phosphatase NrnA [Bacteroidota bacterium]MDP3147289.1 bifunctional oligoribonuclease/PAP phosphatase NrnA [Bacteroidota bacterium]MDP3557337.1 bifunctional oligoribonuclease/PAP phosphatase NrnA [Bacteroidota bacterium]
MQKYSYTKFKTVLKKTNNIIITTHWSPDGDAMGSSLALYNYLIKLGKNVKVVVPNAYPEFLDWLPGNKQVIIHQKNETKVEKLVKAADLIFTLDFNSFKRIEKLGELIEKANKPIVMVDHHQMPDDYASYYFHDVKACSTCELIFDLIVGLGGKKLIDKKIAACLYTGIMTDTGSFRYPSVTAKTHLVISELLKTGMIPADIHSAIYDTYSFERIKLLGYLLSEKMALVDDLPVAYFGITEAELKKFNYQKGDTEGIVNYPFSIKGIKVCALFMESEGYIKISFRSKGKIDVNKFAREHFNGGGHINAAGGKSDLSLDATVNKFITLAKTLF